MTQKLEDLLKSFSSSTFEEQLDKIKNIRNARTFERPAAAVKRVKKAAKKSNTASNKARDLLAGITPEQKALLVKRLLEMKK